MRSCAPKTRHRAVHRARRKGHDQRALRQRAPGVLVVDNGSSHNGTRSVQRMHDAWPTEKLVHLPVHASWLNRVSIVQRKIVKPQNFSDLDELAQRLPRPRCGFPGEGLVLAV